MKTAGMKPTAIVRKIDRLGRIVIPKEVMKNLKINNFDDIEILVDNNAIVLKKYEQGCIFCGEISNTTDIMDKKVCGKCKEKIAGLD